jgi:hypothetical protein
VVDDIAAKANIPERVCERGLGGITRRPRLTLIVSILRLFTKLTTRSNVHGNTFYDGDDGQFVHNSVESCGCGLRPDLLHKKHGVLRGYRDGEGDDHHVRVLSRVESWGNFQPETGCSSNHTKEWSASMVILLRSSMEPSGSCHGLSTIPLQVCFPSIRNKLYMTMLKVKRLWTDMLVCSLAVRQDAYIEYLLTNSLFLSMAYGWLA